MIKEFMAKMKPPAATVTAERAGTKEWIDRVQSIGTLIAIQGVDVAPEVAGIVKEYYLRERQRCGEGRPSSSQLDTSVEEADLAKNRAVLLEANADLKRQASLVKKEFVSQAVVDTTTSKRDTAAASVQRMEAVIAQKNITAPFAGRLGLRRVEKGQYVKAGDPLVWLQSLDPIWIDFPVPEGDLGKLKMGAPIELGVNAYPGQVFKGEIEAFDARVAQDTRTLMVRGRSAQCRPQAAARHVRQCRRARGQAEGARDRAAHRGHLRPLWRQRVGGEGGPAGAGEDGKRRRGRGAGAEAHRRAPLRARRPEPRATEVAILEGVKAGEQVVTSGQLKLHPDAAIKIDNSRPLTPAAERPKQ